MHHGMNKLCELETEMNVFVKERAHQSVVAWCLHQCPGDTSPINHQEAPLQLSVREKDFLQYSAIEKALGI